MSLGPITISSIGFFLFLSFLLGSFLFWRKAKEEHFDDADIFDLIFLTLIVGIIGARLFYILINLDKFGFNIGRWFNLNFDNGFSWLGFLIGYMYVLKGVCKHKKWNFFEIADLSVFGIVLGQIFYRFGQFLDGSYLGKTTNLPIGFIFPGQNIARHAVTLYEILFLIILYLILKKFEKSYRFFSWYQTDRGEARAGFLWLSYLLTLVGFNIGLDFLFETRTLIFWVISLNQIILILILIAIIFTFWLRAGNEFNLSKFFNKFIPEEKENNKIIRPVSEKLQLHERPKRFLRTKAGTDAK